MVGGVVMMASSDAQLPGKDVTTSRCTNLHTFMHRARRQAVSPPSKNQLPGLRGGVESSRTGQRGT